MEIIKTIRRNLAAGGLATLGALTLLGCNSETADHEGIGNEFIVRGPISDSEDHGLIQIHEDEIEIVEVNGEATSWFGDHRGQGLFSDEFDFLQTISQEPGGWFSCGTDVIIGTVHDSNDNQIEPEELDPGDIVEIHGRIRDSAYYQSTGKSGYCTHKNLAVFDTVSVLPQ